MSDDYPNIPTETRPKQMPSWLAGFLSALITSTVMLMAYDRFINKKEYTMAVDMRGVFLRQWEEIRAGRISPQEAEQSLIYFARVIKGMPVNVILVPKEDVGKQADVVNQNP